MSGPMDPFRRDARIERQAECAPLDVAFAVIDRTWPMRRWWLAYLATIAAGTLALALAVPAARTTGLASTACIALFAALVQHSLRRQRQRVEASLSRRCGFTREGMLLAGDAGESAWRYDGVRGLERWGPWLVVVLHGELVAVLRDDDGALESCVAERTTKRVPSSHRARVRKLLAMGVAWVVIVGVALVAAR
jgi:hypothetical protein